jgi:HTH-type transcriptional regulator/antitoxin HigA
VEELKPIRTKAEYDAAMKEIWRLWDTAEPGTPEGNRIEMLAMLVEAYEKEHYSIKLPDPIDAIEHCIESRGLTHRDLVPYLGSPSRVSEIVNRRRPLTLQMIRNLEEGLGIPASILVQKYDLSVAKEAKAERPSAKRERGNAAADFAFSLRERTGRTRKTQTEIATPRRSKHRHGNELAT